MIISASYTTALALAHTHNWTLSPLNPAIALAEITMTTFEQGTSVMNSAWIFLVFGWVGSLLAVLAFEFGFKKAQFLIEENEAHEEAEQETESLLYNYSSNQSNPSSVMSESPKVV